MCSRGTCGIHIQLKDKRDPVPCQRCLANKEREIEWLRQLEMTLMRDLDCVKISIDEMDGTGTCTAELVCWACCYTFAFHMQHIGLTKVTLTALCIRVGRIRQASSSLVQNARRQGIEVFCGRDIKMVWPRCLTWKSTQESDHEITCSNKEDHFATCRFVGNDSMNRLPNIAHLR